MLHLTSVLPSYSLLAPGTRIPGPAIPCRTAPGCLHSPSFLPANPGFFEALQFPRSCGPAVVSPHLRAIRLVRNYRARTESPRAPLTSGALACQVYRWALAQPTRPAPASVCLASARARSKAAIEMLL